MTGHSQGMRPAAALDAPCPEERADPGTQPSDHAGEGLAFAEVYEAHFDYVWRAARRLGAEPSWLDDVAQDVFVTVHRHLRRLQGRSSVRTWLYGITLRVVRDYRRTRRRKPTQPLPAEELPREGAPDPERATQHAESVALLHALLDGLSDDKREVFVLTELETVGPGDRTAAGFEREHGLRATEGGPRRLRARVAAPSRAPRRGAEMIDDGNDELSPQARTLLQAGRDADLPGASDRARVRTKLALQLAGAAAGAAAGKAAAQLAVGGKIGAGTLTRCSRWRCWGSPVWA